MSTDPGTPVSPRTRQVVRALLQAISEHPGCYVTAHEVSVHDGGWPAATWMALLDAQRQGLARCERHYWTVTDKAAQLTEVTSDER